MNILLDYIFPIQAIEPTPEASTAFLKQILVVVKKKSGGVDNVITQCTTQTEIAAVTDNLDAQYVLNGGMSRVKVLTVADLGDVAAQILGKESDFFTMIISSDFTDSNVTTDLDVGAFEGVVAVQSNDKTTFLLAQAVIENRVAFYDTTTNKAKNLCFAFGKMMSNPLQWRNQQYITMPFASDVANLGVAETLFDERVSFVMADTQYGNRLAFFVVGGKAVVSPYIKRNLQVDMQSKALGYISANQPGYTKTQAALLEDELQKVVDEYIAVQWIEDGTVSVALVEDNFVASGEINIAEPKALWRIFGEMRATL